MNIFDLYLEKIKKIILDLSKNGDLILPDKLDAITAEIPPSKFNSDISTNSIKHSDIIWISSNWTWKKIPKKYLSSKKVICSVYHIDFDKFDKKQEKNFNNLCLSKPSNNPLRLLLVAMPNKYPSLKRSLITSYALGYR